MRYCISCDAEANASLVKGRWHGEAVTEGLSYYVSIPQSASLTAPFAQGGLIKKSPLGLFFYLSPLPPQEEQSFVP